MKENNKNLSNARGRKSAFTLAEALIAIAIVGIVAAMVMPPLIKNVQDAHFRNKLKKAYTELNDVSKLLLVEYDENYAAACSTYNDVCLMNLFKSKMKVRKVCNNGNGCWSNSIKSKRNAASYPVINGDIGFGRPVFITSSGYSVRFRFHEQTNNHWGWFLVDVNGPSGPNIFGRDVYMLTLLKGGIIVPDPNPGEVGKYSKTYAERKTQCETNGYYCSSIYLFDE